MKRTLMPIILLVILAAEGVAMELLPPSIKYASIYITPHWVLLFLILIVAYGYPGNTLIPILYAALFGLMIDVVYTGVLGIYMFVLAVVIYVAQLLTRLLQANFLVLLLISVISLFTMEIGLLAIYTLLGFTTMPMQEFFINRFSPTLLANLLFMIVIFYPSKKILTWMNDGETM